ncbi:hypothetical protein FU139_04560 [Burkholderia territorii]|nr:hypothetical protein FU139_04560 [Burkholderia territorii]
MHVAWMQCSENPALAYRAFVANCNSTRLSPPGGCAAPPGALPCGCRDSVGPAISRHADRSVLPDSASAARTLP